jgi:hypothetical protein
MSLPYKAAAAAQDLAAQAMKTVAIFQHGEGDGDVPWADLAHMLYELGGDSSCPEPAGSFTSFMPSHAVHSRWY